MDLTRLKQINKDNLERQRREEERLQDKVAQLDLQETVVKSFGMLVDYLEGKVTKTVVVNQLKEIATPDALKVVDAVNSLHDTLKTKETDLSEVTGVLKSILDEAKSIPKKLPEHKEPKVIDYSGQFKNLQKTVEGLQKVVEKKNLEVTVQPQENPAPIVNVEKPDLEPVRKEITNVVKSVKGLVFPEYKTDNKEVEKLLRKSNKLLEELLDQPTGGGGGGSSWTAVDENGTPVPLTTVGGAITNASYDLQVDDTGTYTYLGNALPGTATSASTWRIKRVVNATGVITHADGTANFNKTWDSRAGYSY